MQWVLLLALVFSLASRSDAAEIRVPRDAPTIGAAIEQAVVGDSILVACGTYREHDLLLTPGVALIGESPGCVVIDAEGASRCLELPVDYYTATLIQGITFRGGHARGTGKSGLGGGLYTVNPTIVEDCTFLQNTADGSGGGFHGSGDLIRCRFLGNRAGGAGGGVAYSGVGLIRDCFFERNECTGSGGGLDTGWSRVEECTFLENRAGGTGGGLQIRSSGAAQIWNCRFERNQAVSGGGAATGSTVDAGFFFCKFRRNRASNHGGGLYVSSAIFPTRFCVFAENHADGKGGGYAAFANRHSRSSRLYHCTFWRNSASEGGGVAGLFLGAPWFTRCLIVESTSGGALAWEQGNGPLLTCSNLYGNVGGDWTGPIAHLRDQYDNLEADPLLCAPEELDFHVATGSPCIRENNSCSQLIGAYGEGCGSPREPLAVTQRSWGRIKASFR